MEVKQDPHEGSLVFEKVLKDLQAKLKAQLDDKNGWAFELYERFGREDEDAQSLIWNPLMSDDATLLFSPYMHCLLVVDASLPRGCAIKHSYVDDLHALRC